jgi:sugar phosphate isomerase/epimerase
MKLSFTTLGCPDWSLQQIAANAQACGYDGVELRTHTDNNHFSPDATAEEAQRTAQMFREHGVPVVSVMGYCRFAHLDDAEVAKNQELMRKLIGVARAMKAPYIRTFAGQIPKGATLDAMIVKAGDALRPLAKEAAAAGVKIGLETHDDWCGSGPVLNLIQRIDCANGFGVIYDIFNSFHSGIEPWDVTYKNLKPHILYCHLKDAWQGADGKHHYVPVGAGDLPAAEILRRFKQDGYDSYFSFEWEKKWHPEIENPERVFPHFVHKVKALWNAK